MNGKKENYEQLNDLNNSTLIQEVKKDCFTRFEFHEMMNGRKESKGGLMIQTNDFESLKELDVRNKNMNYLETFLEADIDTRITPLICACYYGRNDIVKMLLENETIDIDMCSEEAGHTPLTISCMTGNYEILRILTAAGAEVNKPTAFNHTPFICCFQRLEEEQNMFENRKICLKMAEHLLQFGSDINWIVDKLKGYTLLAQLCSIKMELTQKERDTNYEIIKFLIENGANKEIVSNKAKKAIQLAEKHSNRAEIIEILEKGRQIYFYGPTKVPKSEIKESNGKNSKMKFLANYLNFCSK